jgi:hypothetical protein
VPDRDAHILDFPARPSGAVRVTPGRAPARPPVEPPRIGVVPDLHRTGARERTPDVAGLYASAARRERTPSIAPAAGGPASATPSERSAAAAAELSATATGAAPSRVTALRPAPITTLSQRPTAEPTPPAA